MDRGFPFVYLQHTFHLRLNLTCILMITGPIACFEDGEATNRRQVPWRSSGAPVQLLSDRHQSGFEVFYS